MAVATSDQSERTAVSTVKHAGATFVERSLLAVCGFEWSSGLGVWIDSHGNRWDETSDAIEECHAMADLGYRVARDEEQVGP